MLCDVCKCNDATVFLTQILEGKMQKVNLCDACSKEKGVQDPTGFALADLLLGIGAAEEIEKGAPTQKCPVCGFTPGGFQEDRTARLQRVLRYVCRRPGHVLKSDAQGHRARRQIPAARAARPWQLTDRMRALTENLQKAVAEENYETAASLRDQIKQLEHELAKSP